MPAETATKRGPGRPSPFEGRELEIIEAICDRLRKGEPLAKICRDEGMPDGDTVRIWMDKDEEINRMVVRGRIEGWDAIALDALDIADDRSRDYVETEDGPVLDREHIQRSKLRVETRLKLLACWDPKRYGAQAAQATTVNVGVGVQIAMSEDQLRSLQEKKRLALEERKASERGA